MTTGPLGQGVADGVGMGIAERWLRTDFSPELCDHHTYVIAGDGCFEEGISHEAASLAGHLDLGRLVYVYDDNHITIDGPTELSYTDDVGERFAAYGWSVDDIGEVANDLDAIEAALLRAKAEEDRPSLIILRSHIGYPSPHLTDTAKAHGDPSRVEEIKLTKEILGLPPEESFWVPEDVARVLPALHPPWRGLPFGLGQASCGVGTETRLRWGCGPSGLRHTRWESTPADVLPRRRADGHPEGNQSVSRRHRRLHTRSHPRQRRSDRKHRDGLGGVPRLRNRPSPGGSLIHYGIREHGMGVHHERHGRPPVACCPSAGPSSSSATTCAGPCGSPPSPTSTSSTRGPMTPSAWDRTHPTHQPVEQLAAMRAMPNLRVIRPADATLRRPQAWRIAVEG